MVAIGTFVCFVQPFRPFFIWLKIPFFTFLQLFSSIAWGYVFGVENIKNIECDEDHMQYLERPNAFKFDELDWPSSTLFVNNILEDPVNRTYEQYLFTVIFHAGKLFDLLNRLPLDQGHGNGMRKKM